MQFQMQSTQQTVPPIAIDPQPLIEHGESPTAVILAITILVSVILRQTRPSR